MRSPAPAYAEPVADFGMLPALRQREGVEVAFDVDRGDLIATIERLRTEFEYQQLMEIAGVDFPDRPERFEVVYCLLSLTKNHRIRLHVATDEEAPVPSVTHIWPVAGWLEREVYDMYGVFFEGNGDLRRILTDYGFTGHPQRKDFPLSGFVELRFSEEEKRVVYEPVQLAQDFRTFDFMSPWEGAAYVLPGDEKAALPEAKGAQTPLTAAEIAKADAATTPKKSAPKPKVSEGTADTGSGKAGPGDGPKPKKRDVKPTPGKGQNQ